MEMPGVDLIVIDCQGVGILHSHIHNAPFSEHAHWAAIVGAQRRLWKCKDIIVLNMEVWRRVEPMIPLILYFNATIMGVAWCI